MRTTMEIIEEARKQAARFSLEGAPQVAALLAELAQRVLELESREDVRDRIEPIMRGEKPRQGA